MENNLNSGTIEALQPGQTLLVSARQVSNGSKVQLEFAEQIATTDRPINALTILNASDSRFSSGARRAWVTAEPSDASERFGIDFTSANEAWYMGARGEMMDLNILSPSLTMNGNKLYFKVQIEESTKPTDWEADNIEKAAKRAGKDGDYITHNGDYIFSRTIVSLLSKGVAAKHTLLESDTNKMQVTANQGVAVEALETELDDMGL